MTLSESEVPSPTPPRGEVTEQLPTEISEVGDDTAVRSRFGGVWGFSGKYAGDGVVEVVGGYCFSADAEVRVHIVNAATVFGFAVLIKYERFRGDFCAEMFDECVGFVNRLSESEIEV